MSAKFTLFKDKAGQFRFNLKAANGEIIAAASESYPDKKSALKGIASIVRNAPVAKIDDITEDKAAKKPGAKPAAGAKKPAKPKAAPIVAPKAEAKADPKL